MVHNEKYNEHKQNLIKVLSKYVPESAADLCASLIIEHKVHLHIEVERKSKYGDFTPHSGKGSKITVNHNLSKYEFLVTFIHELAHHTAYYKYGRNHEPHGQEWKQEFKYCMHPFLQTDIFPYDLKAAIAKHMQNPKYSHASDVNLLKALKRYDEKATHLVLDQLQNNAYFKMKNSVVVMQKGNKLRTYYHCIAVETKKAYRVHAMAEIIEVKM